MRERQRRLGHRGQPDPAAQQGADHLAGLGRRDELLRREREHPSVQEPGRQDEHVGGEPVTADVAALPDPSRPLCGERGGDRPAAQRATRVVLAVRADQVDRVRVGFAGGPVKRKLGQFGVGVELAPAQRLRPVAGVDQRPAAQTHRAACVPAGARPVPGRRRLGPAPRPRPRRPGRTANRAARANPTGRAARRAAAGRPGTRCRASGRREAARAARTARASRAGAARCRPALTPPRQRERRPLRGPAAGRR